MPYIFLRGKQKYWMTREKKMYLLYYKKLKSNVRTYFDDGRNGKKKLKRA